MENIYPGVRCDIPANVYQSTFSPNTQWSQQFAEGAEIRGYWQDIARKYDVYKYIRFGHQVTGLDWDAAAAKWRVSLKTNEQELLEDFDFVLPAIGHFNDWRLPEYPGIEEYKGLLRHTSNWDPTFDPAGKRVAVIGNGASGIQVVPNLQRIAAHVDHYARNKTWVAASWAGDVRTFEPQYFSPEQLKSFEDPDTYLKYRKELEEKYWRGFRSVFRGSEQNEKVRTTSVELVKQRLASHPELADSVIPDFPPSCRRLTPGPGYLEALVAPNVTYVTTPIERFTATGITTTDGVNRPVDAVFAATGANTDFKPPFPITANNIDLRSAWLPGGKWGYPYTYLGFATPEIPNLLWILGAHAAGASGTVTHAVELQITYYAKLLRKVSSQGIRSIAPSTPATDDFIAYANRFFPATVFSENCSSWANSGVAGSFIHGHWPGSASHLALVRREPRWEDWVYTYHGSHADGAAETKDRFAYFGAGWTKRELDVGFDITAYLKKPGEDVDLKSLHENWWE